MVLIDNTSELKVPYQLNSEFFKKALENGLNLSNIEIKNLKFSQGSQEGDNYCSQIFRVAIQYTARNEEKSTSVIVKYILNSDDRKLIQDMRFFDRENQMYMNMIPKMEKLLGAGTKLTPKCLYSISTPEQIMVFEDLKELNYEMADRISGLNEDQCKLVLDKLAQYHAASMVIAKKDPESIKCFNITIFHDDSEKATRDEICLGNLRYMRDYLSKWQDYDTIVEKLKKVEDEFYEKGLNSVIYKPNGVSVLNHGDLWTNNLMFRKNDKTQKNEVIFLDLQIAYYGSPGIDINYFLNSSLPIDLLKSKRYELLRYYYAKLRLTLEELKYSEIPSWDQIKNEVNATEFYGFFTFEYLLPLLLIDRDASKDNTFESFTDKDKMEINRRIAFNTKRMIETMKYSLDRFDELGVFD